MMDRREEVLFNLIEEFISTGMPVGSSVLAQKYNFKLSPATIRNILHDLDAEGYIWQPHTSAGRVPTDKGYREYVNWKQQQKQLSKEINKAWQKEYRNLVKEYGNVGYALIHILSEMSSLLAVFGDLEDGHFEQFGMSKLTKLMDDDRGLIKEVSFLLDHLRAYAPALNELNKKETTVYIGAENPYYSSRYTSLLVRPINESRGQQVVVMLVGPKRMNYQRNISFMDEVAAINL